jgi:hypothetical protein
VSEFRRMIPGSYSDVRTGTLTRMACFCSLRLLSSGNTSIKTFERGYAPFSPLRSRCKIRASLCRRTVTGQEAGLHQNP